MSINRPLYKFKRRRQHQQFAEQACKQDLRFVYYGARRSRMMKTTSDLGDSALKFQTSERQLLLQKDEDKHKSVLGASTAIAEWVRSHVQMCWILTRQKQGAPTNMPINLHMQLRYRNIGACNIQPRQNGMNTIWPKNTGKSWRM